MKFYYYFIIIKKKKTNNNTALLTRKKREQQPTTNGCLTSYLADWTNLNSSRHRSRRNCNFTRVYNVFSLNIVPVDFCWLICSTRRGSRMASKWLKALPSTKGMLNKPNKKHQATSKNGSGKASRITFEKYIAAHDTEPTVVLTTSIPINSYAL